MPLLTKKIVINTKDIAVGLVANGQYSTKQGVLWTPWGAGASLSWEMGARFFPFLLPKKIYQKQMATILGLPFQLNS